jgi:stage II sporulation protein AB (anti-sigma F factor)
VSAWHLQAPVEPLSETYPPVAESVTRARRSLARLASACGAAVDQIDAIRLAVSEAMTNAVLHGDGGEDGIRLHAAVVDDALAVSIDADRSQLPSIRADAGLGSGLGLALIAHASDELAIAHRPSGGSEVRMRFGLGAVSPRT